MSAGARTAPKAAAEAGPVASKPAGSTRTAGEIVSATHQARQMLARAHWAAGAFATYDRETVLRIAETVARAAHAESARYADWAVKETGFGVAEHKTIKNQ